MEVEASVSRPEMELTASSIFWVTSVSTSSGEAPLRRVVMVTDGDVDLGELIEAELEVASGADDDDGEREDGGEDRAPDAEADEPVHGGA